jgi:curli biogenesis system outer membrane secretion channel CsgG
MRNKSIGTLTSVLVLCAACATITTEKSVSSPTAGADISPSSAQSGRTLKRKVIIARFSNETTYGKSVLLGDRSNRVARQASDMLATRLTQSGKFLLFERTNADPILKALDNQSLGGMGLPADFLIVGSLSEFGRKETSDTGVFSRTKKQTTVARVNVRLIDVKTSRVLFADEGAGKAESETGTTLGVGSKAGYDSSLNDAAISAAVSKLVNNLMEKLLDQPWRSYLLANEGGTVTIGGGKAQGLQVGDKFDVIKRGRTVKNPQTSAITELPGTRVATLEVTALFGDTPENELSQCKVVDGSLAAGAKLADYVIEESKR